MSNYKNISLEKDMYGVKGKSFTDVLEELDPSENYRGTSLENLDAFSRQLKRFDIKVSGKGSDTVDKFFSTSNSSVLFPEYISRAVKQGMNQADVLSNIVATTTMIENMDYRSITSEPTSDDKSLKVVMEGTRIPQTTIKSQNNLIKLHKRGRLLVSSYEVIRFQRLDLFAVALKQIGAYIARAQLKDAVDVLINGDGNNNPATSISTSSTDNISYSDLVKLWSSLSPYELNTIIAPTASMEKLLSLNEMKDAAGLNFQGTGKMITPMGANVIHAPEIIGNYIIGVDKNCALEMVKAGDVQTEYDKLIDRQLERAAITSIAGFGKIFNDSVKVLKYHHI